ncbi:MAG: protein arginine kinase [Candidatus Omnitrophica bacterium]|nr:protein arginine kinase [Candidatus Omnitrophota bacterium]MBD3269134.1 protein arginine kinase [Candidatus Omnitrophota bacterium]
MFEDLIINKDSWLNGRGPASEIVFSSRVRLARNLRSSVFPPRANSEKRKDTLKRIFGAARKIKALDEAKFYEMEQLKDLDGKFLVERHLISREHLVSGAGRGLILSSNERISVMVNEEDHIRMQAMASGLNLENCWGELNVLDDEFSKNLDFSFRKDLGYLTSCPTNMGTGMRVSCMLHLPALTLTKKVGKILEFLSKIFFTSRGLFGEGTQAIGDFYQISNQVSLGVSETELVDNLKSVVNQVKTQEISARKMLLDKHRITLEDNIWRTLGVLKNCRLIGSKEALNHLSMLSLGLDLGIIGDKDLSVSPSKGRELINNLILVIQPAHLQKIESKMLSDSERDYFRAQTLRKNLGGKDV